MAAAANGALEYRRQGPYPPHTLSTHQPPTPAQPWQTTPAWRLQRPACQSTEGMRCPAAVRV
eukprot:160043-Chlamydomonas_euryale.AAC.1